MKLTKLPCTGSVQTYTTQTQSERQTPVAQEGTSQLRGDHYFYGDVTEPAPAPQVTYRPSINSYADAIAYGGAEAYARLGAVGIYSQNDWNRCYTRDPFVTRLNGLTEGSRIQFANLRTGEGVWEAAFEPLFDEVVSAEMAAKGVLVALNEADLALRGIKPGDRIAVRELRPDGTTSEAVLLQQTSFPQGQTFYDESIPEAGNLNPTRRTMYGPGYQDTTAPALGHFELAFDPAQRTVELRSSYGVEVSSLVTLQNEADPLNSVASASVLHDGQLKLQVRGGETDAFRLTVADGAGNQARYRIVPQTGTVELLANGQ